MSLSSSQTSPDAASQATSRPHKKRIDGELYRKEVIARVAAGETCDQIAAALTANGQPVSSKTVSKWRVRWGLRQRAVRAHAGEPLAKPRARKAVSAEKAASTVHKQVLEDLTRSGKSAEEIAEILQARGVLLKKGAATVWRLQTFWGLIAPDADRTKGRGKYKKNRHEQPRSRKARKASVAMDAATGEPPSQYYPSNCSFGPLNGRRRHQNGREAIDADDDDGGMPMIVDTDENATDDDADTANGQQTTMSPVMMAEMLVDLADSALTAALKHKHLVIAAYKHQPDPESNSVWPPTEEDIAVALRNVREATVVVMDLAG